MITGGGDRLHDGVPPLLRQSPSEDPQLIVLYEPLTDAGKPHKLALIPCAREVVVIFENAVLTRPI